MLQLFFLQYYYPSEWSSHCGSGVINGDGGKGYSEADGSHKLYGTFCPNSDSSLRFKGYTDKTSWWIKTDSGSSSGGCDKDNSAGCCSYDTTVYGFHAHKCYPYYSHHQENCWGETDKNEILYNGNRLHGDSYTCSDYNDCKGFYYGSNCQNAVDSYDEAKNCKVSLGVSGTGNCDCSSATTMQDYCLNRYNPNGVQYFRRENSNAQWVNKGTLDTIKFTPTEDNYYNQYRIQGKIILTDKTKDYSFQLVTTTPATFQIGNKEKKGQLNFVHCDPTAKYTYQLNYGKPSTVGEVDVVIEIDTGCSIDKVDLELKWIVGSGSFTSIPKKYILH